MPWISRGEYRRLLRQLAKSEDRAEKAESALSAERAGYMVDVRHLIGMVLRAKGSYPLPERHLPPREPALTTPPTDQPAEGMDEGEYEALIEAAAGYGVDRPSVDLLLARERGRVL